MNMENIFALPVIEKEDLKQQQIDDLSSILHDKWRQSLVVKKESRLESTDDIEWITKNGRKEVDLVNTLYKDLPNDWKEENKASAKVAFSEIYKAQEEGQVLDDYFVEKASELIHLRWLERNSDSKFSYQDMPYDALSEEEKEKDRLVVKEAINIFNNSNEEIKS